MPCYSPFAVASRLTVVASLLCLAAGGCCCINLPSAGGTWTPTPSPHIVNVTDADFDTVVVQSEKPTLVDFWAPWCGPCRMVDPALVTMADEFQSEINVARLNVDENSGTAFEYNASSIPLLVLFHDGAVVAQHIGVPMDAGGSVEQSTRTWLKSQLETLPK